MSFDVYPFRYSGVVVGALLNHRAEWVALGAEVMSQPLYKGAPQAPVLMVKPRNTLVGPGQAVRVPEGASGGDGAAALRVGATLGVVLGRTACRVSAAEALQCVAGYTLAVDLQVPQASHYRPSVRWRARDGFCPISPQVVPAAQVPDPDALTLQVWVDGLLVHTTTTGDRVRSVAQLLADVSAFMTLQPGDVLLLGASEGAPVVKAGHTVRCAIRGLAGLDPIDTPLVRDPHSVAAADAAAAAVAASVSATSLPTTTQEPRS